MEDAFKQFWQASNLSPSTSANYAKRMSAYDANNKNLKLLYPNEPLKLPRKTTKLSKITNSRSSSRDFSTDYISKKDVSRLLQSLATINGDLEHRTYPSAGATYSVETFLISFGGELGNHAYYYHPQNHGITRIKALTISETKLKQLTNLGYTGNPSLLVLFVGCGERVSAKYDQRGYRFMLIEAGAMLQQLSLAIADNKHVAGCAIGGLLDDELLQYVDQNKPDRYLLSGLIIGKK